MAERNGRSSIAGGLMLFGAAFIWGVAFVFQVEGMDHITPVTFMAARCLLASVFLAVLVIILRGPKDAFRFDKATLKGGLGCGICITIANNLQQIGIQYTTAGKAGFLTGLYMLLVPVFGALIFSRKVSLKTWIAVLIGAAGMYLLCIKEG
ncbi:MAG: DMT family transporter, partial [Firmicutes bacterium]|nr:DMT family transporter [Bacillota bacterium]